jgi:endo-1,4-beta-xylanase
MRVCLRALKRQRVLGAIAVLVGMSWALFWFAGSVEVEASTPRGEPLRSYADKMHFWLGTTLQGLFWNNPKYVQLLSTHFNSGVSMVLLGQTQPQPGSYDLHIIDNQMEFARQHDMKLFGVNLIYRPFIGPEWFFKTCKTWSKEKMDSFLKDRINTLVRRGGDTYYGWEVVNEPLVGSHNGCWSKVLGDPDYIAKAFRYAHEANPNAELLLNESFGHDGIDKPRAKEFFDLIRKLKSDKIHIDAAGTEMHLQTQNLRPTYVDEFKWFLAEARDVGVQVQVTEMDVTLPPGGGPDLLQKQKEIFYNILHACLKDSNCTGFTLWGTGDSIRRRGNDTSEREFAQQKPNIFDENLEPKPAYEGILQALKEGR